MSRPSAGDRARSLRAIVEKLPGLRDVSSDALDTALLAAEEGEALDAQVIYGAAEPVAHLFVVLAGRVGLEAVGSAVGRTRWLGPGDTFGWEAVGGGRPERATSDGPSTLARIPERALFQALAAGAPGGKRRRTAGEFVRAMAETTLRSLRSPTPYRRLLGYALFFGGWYLAVEVLALPHFNRLPGITEVVREWLSKDPVFGLSIYTPEYYAHIGCSLRRVAIAFLLATALGVPVGLALGSSTRFREYVFPVFELLRPVPIPAWIPLAILVFSGTEAPIVFLTLLASFFATALNTFLGVRSIDPKYVLAARCLGASPWQVFRHVVVPGSLPFVLTGLQISVGVAWFSIAAAEMCSGQFGLGYLINTSYAMVQFPTIVIGMLTLGILGFATSAVVRLLGERLVVWRARELAMERP
jgi:ABC-type nitrate/sulfonate/bicarbonate transport system permease component